jgi:hypothetical protein
VADVLAYTFNKANINKGCHPERLGRKKIITDAYSVLQNYLIPDSEYDYGAMLPAILSNEILAKINKFILKPKNKALINKHETLV